MLNHREVEADIMAALAASTAAAAHDTRKRGSGLAADPPQDDITRGIMMCTEDDRRTREEAERLAGEEAVQSVDAMKRADRATRRAALGAARPCGRTAAWKASASMHLR